MQKTANISATQHAQLVSHMSSQLYKITKILDTNFACIEEELKQSLYTQNLIYNTMESRCQT